MQFPSDFIEKYNKLLGDEAEEFFASFDQEAVSAYRTNPLKKQQKNRRNGQISSEEPGMQEVKQNFISII